GGGRRVPDREIAFPALRAGRREREPPPPGWQALPGADSSGWTLRLTPWCRDRMWTCDAGRPANARCHRRRRAPACQTPCRTADHRPAIAHGLGTSGRGRKSLLLDGDEETEKYSRELW